MTQAAPIAASANYNKWTAAAYGTSALTSIATSYAQAQSIKAKNIYESAILDINASFADIQALDSIERGEFAAAEIKRKSEKNLSYVRNRIKETSGKQRVAMAAQGIESTSGSAADILSETAFLGELDENEIRANARLDMITAKNNAWREAWGFKAEAEGTRFKSRLSKSSAETNARNTILTGILEGASKTTLAVGSLYR